MSKDPPQAAAQPPRRSPDPVRTAIREAVGAYAAPEVADRILDRALSLGTGPPFPQGGAPLIEFIDGPLEAAVTEVLGSNAANHILEELRPILAMAGQPFRSGVRERAAGTRGEPDGHPAEEDWDEATPIWKPVGKAG